MRRASVLVSNVVAATPKYTHKCSIQELQLRHGLRLATNVSSTISRFLSSAAEDRSEPLNDSAAQKQDSKDDPKKNEAIKFILKKGNGRMTSAEFFASVKKAVGENVPDEKFVIPRAAYDAIAGEYDAVCEEAASFKDKYTRALAETENVRRRGAKQVEETKLFHLQKFSKDLIGVRDILDLAVQSVKQEDIDENPKLKAFHEGIVMTCEVFEKTFRTHGIERISPLGEKFNPNLHEAVFQVPKDKAKNKPGYVEEVMTIGYALHGRPIRAAKVAVVAE